MENINWECYQQGFVAWDVYVESNWSTKSPNPYQKDTIEWRSWNRGWNTNYNGLIINPPGETGK